MAKCSTWHVDNVFLNAFRLKFRLSNSTSPKTACSLKIPKTKKIGKLFRACADKSLPCSSLHFSGFRGRVSLISQGKKELFGAGYPLPGFVYTKTNIHLSDIYVATSQLGIYPPLFTFTSVNKCLFKHDNVDEQEMLAKSLCPKKNAVIFLTENCNR